MLEHDRDKTGSQLSGRAAMSMLPDGGRHRGTTELPHDPQRSAALPAAVPQPAVLIRDAEDSDAPGLTHIIAAIMGEFPGCIFDLEADFPELKRPKTSFKKEGGRLWVAERHLPSATAGKNGQPRKGTGEIAGCFGFLPAEDPGGISARQRSGDQDVQDRPGGRPATLGGLHRAMDRQSVQGGPAFL